MPHRKTKPITTEEKELKEVLSEEVQDAEKEFQTEMKEDFKNLSQEIREFRFSDVIAVLDEYKDESLFQKIEKTLLDRLKVISKVAYEDRGTTYYYLIRNSLNKNLMKEAMLSNYLQRMIENFSKYEKAILKGIHSEQKQKKLSFRPQEIQAMAFLKIIESYFINLENLLKKKHIPELASHAYKQRMHYRKSLFFLKKDYFSWLAYNVWSITSHYGENFLRWGMTSICFVLFFSAVFWLTGEAESVPLNKDGLMLLHHVSQQDISGYTNHPMLYKYGGTWYDYIYFSVVVFTTLGFGDIVPVMPIEKIITVIAVMTGYTMLGVFMTLLAKKF